VIFVNPAQYRPTCEFSSFLLTQNTVDFLSNILSKQSTCDQKTIMNL